MRFFLLLMMILAFVLTSCSNFEESIASREMRDSEYTRSINGQKIVGWLNHKNPEIRRRAVEMLGRVQDSSGAVLLSNRLNDDDARVRAAAAFSMGQLFSPSVEDFLMEGLRRESDDAVRVKLIEALGKSGTGKNVVPLRDFLESNNAEFRKSAALACGMLAYRNYPPYTLLPSLTANMSKSDDAEVAWRAAYGLYRIGSLAAFDGCVAGLARQNTLVKFFSLKGLQRVVTLLQNPDFEKHKNNPGMRELLKAYAGAEFERRLISQLQDSTWYVRMAALDLMGGMGKRIFQNEIIRMLGDPHPYVRMQAIRSLADYPNWQTRKEMQRLYDSEQDWRLQGEALITLSSVDPQGALEKVKSQWSGAGFPRTAYAIKTLEKIEKDSQGKPLKQAAEARELLIQLADGKIIPQTTLALEVLVRRSDPPDLDFLLERLKSGDMAVATVIATYLSVLRDEKPLQAVAPLIEVYRRFSAPRDLEAMEPILAALDSIGSVEAVPFLKEQLNNPYPAIQQKARRALVHITGDDNIQIPSSQTVYATQWDFSPVSADSIYELTFHTTAGDFTMQLLPEKAPVNVAHLVKLARENFYKGIYFHRVVPGFVVQAGDPRGDGWGGPGYAVPAEYSDVQYERGVVGIADAGKDTGGSQFFITHTPQPHLNGRYTVVGRVVSGMEVVDRLMPYDQIEGSKLAVRKR